MKNKSTTYRVTTMTPQTPKEFAEERIEYLRSLQLKHANNHRAVNNYAIIIQEMEFLLRKLKTGEIK